MNENTIPEELFTESTITIDGDLSLQVREVMDASMSKFELLQKLKSASTGPTGTRQLQEAENDEADNTQAPPAVQDSFNGNGGKVHFHKLVLQDQKGTLCFGFEMKKIPGISMDTRLGTTLMVSGVQSSRGLLLLKPTNTCILDTQGVEEWDSTKQAQLIAKLEGLLNQEQEQ